MGDQAHARAFAGPLQDRTSGDPVWRRLRHRLALRLLVAAHAREHQGGEIVLSSEVTKLQRNNKYRAAEKLQALGLVRIERRGLKQSPIIHILADRAKRKPQK